MEPQNRANLVTLEVHANRFDIIVLIDMYRVFSEATDDDQEVGGLRQDAELAV